MSLSLIGTLLAVVPGLAQVPPGETLPAGQAPVPPSMPAFGRLSVRPRAMATGTRTEQAGEQELEVRDDLMADLYVPPQCVGARRCPLLVVGAYHGGDHTPVFPRLADRYGMILLRNLPAPYPTHNFPLAVLDPGVPYLVREMTTFDEQRVSDLDSALTRILRTFAIDPEKIGIFGNSWGGAATSFTGSVNPEVFSRVAPRAVALRADSPGPPPGPPGPTQFYFSAGTMAGLVNDVEEFYVVMKIALAKRRDGYPVKIVAVPADHIADIDAEAPALFRWFHDSWAAPDSARHAAETAARPEAVPPIPLLTHEAVAQWTTFWTRFMQEPDAIRDGARAAHVKEYLVMLGQEPVTVLLTDLPALAAQYPAVAADLQAAGLTAPQAEGYRLALFSAWVALNVQELERRSEADFQIQTHHYSPIVGDVAPTSVLGQNMALLRAQPELRQRLRAERSWMRLP